MKQSSLLIFAIAIGTGSPAFSWNLNACKNDLINLALRNAQGQQEAAYPTDGFPDADSENLFHRILKVGKEKGLNFKENGSVYPELPDGIPWEIYPAFYELNRTMGNSKAFARWLVLLEHETAREYLFVSTKTPDLSSEMNSLTAIKAVIMKRAKAAGWPEAITLHKDAAWRPMLAQGRLFIDVAFQDTGRKGGSHTAGAHLLQLLYASEALNGKPGLLKNPLFQKRKPMQALMSFMGDDYPVNGKRYPIDTELKWDKQNNPFNTRSLWFGLFDATGDGTNTPENIGVIYHELPHLKQIEFWAKEWKKKPSF